MRRLPLTLLYLLLALPVVYSQVASHVNVNKKPQPTRQLSSRQIAAKALRSAVLIMTTDDQGNSIAQGSGFVFKPGLVVTNLHVLTRASKATVKQVSNGGTYAALDVVAMNAKHDLCVIRIADGSERARRPEDDILAGVTGHRSLPISPLPLAPPGSAKVGDEIYVISNPVGLEGSVTKGIVSSVRNSHEQNDPLGVYEEGVLQIDAAISSGSSGGAVVNERGEVVGIVRSSIIAGQNLNFAIPVQYLKSLRLNLNLPILAAGACAYTDKERDKLRGPVKSVTEKEEINFELGKAIKTVLLPTIRIYDLDGNMVEIHVFGADPKRQYEVTLAFKQIINYDYNRLQTKVTRIEADGRTKTTTFSLDEAIDLKIRIRQFSRVDEAPDYFSGKKTYDYNGNLTQWVMDNEQRIVYRYEVDGRQKEQLNYLKGKLTSITRFSYDDDVRGNWIIKREFIFQPGSDEPAEGTVTFREITYFY